MLAQPEGGSWSPKRKVLWSPEAVSYSQTHFSVSHEPNVPFNIYSLSRYRHQSQLMRKENLLKSYCPGWCGSVDWVSACKPKGRQFDSQSGTCLGGGPDPPSRGAQGATTHGCFTPSFSLPSPLSFSKKSKILKFPNTLPHPEDCPTKRNSISWSFLLSQILNYPKNEGKKDTPILVSEHKLDSGLILDPLHLYK